MIDGNGLEGIGLGLRQPLADELFTRAPESVRWLEIHPENYLRRGGRYATMLARARERWPLVTHGLTLGFGSLEPFDRGYLDDLSALVRELACPWHSEHLCIASVEGVYLHDLLPMPLTHASVAIAVARIREAREALRIPIAVEPISYYAHVPGDELSALEHLNAVLLASDARLLLDVNNVFVNAMNHGFDAERFIDALPLERVVQLHVAGHHVQSDGQRIDTHAAAICTEVYELFEYTMRKLARPVAVLLERDDEFPPFDELLLELERLDDIYRGALALSAAHRSAPSCARART